MVSADSAGSAGRRLRIQHQVPAATRRGRHLLPRQRDSIRESHPRRVRSGVDCGTIHFSGNQSGRTHPVAAAIESARDATAALVEVLGRHDTAARTRLILVFATDVLLQVSGFMMGVSIFTITMMTFAI